VSAREVYDVSTGSYVLASRTTYTYDSTPISNPGGVARHDDANYGAGFQLGRGNLTAVHRFDVTDPYNMAKAAGATTGYDTAGSVVWEQDALGHRVSISYADSFTDGVNRATFAYATTVTDPDNYSSTAQYNYSMGTLFRAVDPKGADFRTLRDPAGRVEREVNATNGAYSRRVYSPASTYVLNFTTLVAGQGESYLSQFFDGAGRLKRNSAYHAGSAGGYRAWLYQYDAQGREVRRSNPTEIDAGWAPAGDDAAGYRWTERRYDWQGRPTLTTFPTGHTVEVTYGGCGCAGGEVSTVRDERGRRKRYTKDVFGRLRQVEELNWDTSVYSTTVYSYNARDQITQINQAGQLRTFEYDAHGRLWRRTTPEQGATTYLYNPDDTVQQMTDARGAATSFFYNARHLVTNVNYGVPAGVAATANVTMGYDAAGNRTSMTDGLGSVTYAYDTLSRLTAETRTFSGLVGSAYMPSGSVTLSYGYNLAGQVTSMYNSWNGVTIGYQYDVDGRLTGVTGAGYAGVGTYASNMQYRAFDGLKRMDYVNNKTLSAQYDARLRLTRWDVAGVLGYEYFYDNSNDPALWLSDRAHRVVYAKNVSSNTAGGGRDASLDRSFDYDHVGRLQYSHSGVEARMYAYNQPNDGGQYGPYARHYGYDVWGNWNYRIGWGGANPSYNATYTNNRRDGLTYDAAGNVV
jgi:YD repeat-containing protein